MSRSGTAIWWLALAVLVLNDHVLKGAGTLPGWLTGKLSDFAGLVVAPVLVVAIVNGRRTRPRAGALAFTFVVAMFAAIKIAPPAAHALELGAGRIGLRWRIWADPTDLVALLVVPFAWRLALPARAAPRRGGTAFRATYDALRTSLGALACVATSAPGADSQSTAFLANLTGDTRVIQIFRAAEPLDCATLAGPAGRTLDGGRFVPEACWPLEPGRARAIGRSRGQGQPAPACDAVVIRTSDLSDTLLAWHHTSEVSFHDYVVYPGAALGADALSEYGIYLERGGGRTYAAGTPLISSEPVMLSAPDQVDCAAETDAAADAADGK